MKKHCTTIISLLLVFVLMFAGTGSIAAQSEAKEYIPVHTGEELSNFLRTIISYLSANGGELLAKIDETETQIVNNALIRATGIASKEDATPQQIDHAYDALFNMALFLGLAAEPDESFSSGKLFEYAVQLLDQEYYDMLADAGEDPDVIDQVKYIRDISEALVEDPESFTPEEVEDWLLEIYAETYLASGLKAIAHTEALPLPEELFPEKEESVMMPNPIVKYDTDEALTKLLGIQMPGLPKELGAKTDYYSIIAELIAEAKYDLPDGGTVLMRLSRETGEDISGIYGASLYDTWRIAGTVVEVDKFEGVFVARGTVKNLDEAEYSFAVNSEKISVDLFRQIVTYFIEGCVNQHTR